MIASTTFVASTSAIESDPLEIEVPGADGGFVRLDRSLVVRSRLLCIFARHANLVRVEHGHDRYVRRQSAALAIHSFLISSRLEPRLVPRPFLLDEPNPHDATKL